MSEWKIAQKNEREWWGKCANTYFEEEKQLKYAEKMGLQRTPNSQTPYVYDMDGKTVLDIGGGPTSILLKCVNVHGTVIDPLEFPAWTLAWGELCGPGRCKSSGETQVRPGRRVSTRPCWLVLVQFFIPPVFRPGYGRLQGQARLGH